MIERAEEPQIPGAGLALRQTEADGTELTAIVRGDSLDLYHGQSTIHSVALSPETARKLAWFILWTWFVKATWIGWKMRAWKQDFQRRLDAKGKLGGANDEAIV